MARDTCPRCGEKTQPGQPRCSTCGAELHRTTPQGGGTTLLDRLGMGSRSTQSMADRAASSFPREDQPAEFELSPEGIAGGESPPKGQMESRSDETSRTAIRPLQLPLPRVPVSSTLFSASLSERVDTAEEGFPCERSS